MTLIDPAPPAWQIRDNRHLIRDSMSEDRERRWRAKVEGEGGVKSECDQRRWGCIPNKAAHFG